jgi:hypothetical protein
MKQTIERAKALAKRIDLATRAGTLDARSQLRWTGKLEIIQSFLNLSADQQKRQAASFNRIMNDWEDQLK